MEEEEDHAEGITKPLLLSPAKYDHLRELCEVDISNLITNIYEGNLNPAPKQIPQNKTNKTAKNNNKSINNRKKNHLQTIRKKRYRYNR